MPDQRDIDDRLVADFRANGGAMAGPGGATLLLLTTTGAKSGRRRTTPLVSLLDGGRFIVVASHQGADKHPDWYHNLLAQPDVTVEVAGERFEARARTLTGEERDRLWQRQVTEQPRFGDYQAKTRRIIPVVALERA